MGSGKWSASKVRYHLYLRGGGGRGGLGTWDRGKGGGWGQG